MILTNGCSFTEGYDLPDRESTWPFRLGKIINKPVVNLALGGGSNERIFRTTKEFLIAHNPELIVIGWTQFDRTEISHSEGAYIRAAPWGCIAECETQFNNLPELHKNWILLNQNTWVNYRNWIHNVLFLEKYFKLAEIPYLFFTAFGNNYISEFINQTDRALELADLSYQWRDRLKYRPEKTIHNEFKELVDLCNQIDLSNWVFNNAHTMGSYLTQQGFDSDHSGHFLEDGHWHWAEILSKEIQ